jgi:diguanylate cyclase (GGDEF)-like protein
MPWGKVGDATTGPIRVLLVEDNPADARFIRELLREVKSSTIELTCVLRLEEALEAVANTPVTIVLLDLNLQDSSGIETFTRLRDLAPDIPVVVLSGLDDENAAVNAMQEGAQDYLVKGDVSGAHLVRAIRYAIERNRMSMAIRSLSLVDELTELYNRRGFLTLAEQQLKTAERLERKAALVFIDLDGMKIINDTFGHNVGNVALRETAEILQMTFRKADIIGRLGGDEFVVLALLEEAEGSDALCQRLEHNLTLCNSQDGRQYLLSLSYGVTIHDPTNTTSLEDMIDEADRLMYEQKKAKKTARESSTPALHQVSHPLA